MEGKYGWEETREENEEEIGRKKLMEDKHIVKKMGRKIGNQMGIILAQAYGESCKAWHVVKMWNAACVCKALQQRVICMYVNSKLW